MVASRQRLTVRTQDASVAMAASSVSEVIRGPRLTRMPHGPTELLGVTHFRGQVLPVVSLSLLLGRGAEPADRVVVLRHDPPIGLAVRGVDALQTVATADDAEPDDGQLLLADGDGARWFDLAAALDSRFSTLRSGARSREPSAERSIADVDAVAANELAFLAFQLAGQDYGIAIDAVSEVDTVPAEIATLPRTADVLLGVAERREGVTPVVSLRGLLGLPPGDLTVSARLVIVRVGGQSLGLVVDRVSAIVRAAADRLAPAPSLFNRGEGEARIDAVLRPRDGGRLLSVLSPAKLLADDRMALLLGTGASEDMQVAEPSLVALRARFIVFRLGSERYGLPIAAVDEVIRAPETLSRLPKAPAYVRGVMNLRGRVIPIIDQRARFSVAGTTAGPGRIVVVTIGALQAGFSVDAVDSILEVEEAALLPAPELSADGVAVFDRVIERDGDVILLIDPKVLLDRAEADLLRDLTAAS